MKVDLKNALQKLAPAIFGVVAGPYAPLAVAGVSAISNAVLGKPDGTEEEIATAVTNGLTPEMVQAMQKADKEFILEAKRLRLQSKQMDLDNTKDARNMQRSILQQEDTYIKRFIYNYTYIVTGFTLSYILMITFFEVPDKNVRFADIILGFMLGTLLATLLNYHFGSSAGSGHKSTMFSKLLERFGRKAGAEEEDD